VPEPKPAPSPPPRRRTNQGRGRKQAEPASDRSSATDQATGTAALPNGPFLTKLDGEVREVLGELMELREMLRAVRLEAQDVRTELQSIREQTDAFKEGLQEAENSLRGLQQGLESAGRELQAECQETRAGLAALRGQEQEIERDLRDAIQEHQAQETHEETPAGERREEQAPEATHHEPTKLLGVTVDAHAVVVEVLPETPAEEAGLQAGDVVVRVDDHAITSGEMLRDVIEHTVTGKEVLVTVSRGEETREMKVHVVEAAAL
jgi:C-terminal processing protease CtpA/Prc